MLAIRLPVEIEQRLQSLAEKTGKTKTFYAKEAILNHLDDLEDIYLAQERIEQPSKRWSMEEVEKELELDH